MQKNIKAFDTIYNTKKQTTRYSLSPSRHAAIYLQKLHLYTSLPHLLINPLKCSSDISDSGIAG